MVRKITFWSLLFVLGVSLLGIGYIFGYLHHATSNGVVESYPLVEEAQNLVTEYYLGEIPEDLTLQRGMIHGMVAKLGDEHTTYIEPQSNELQTDDLMGRFGGIGAYLTRDDAGLIHLVPYPGSPAATAGIQEAYVLIAVDDVTITTEMRNDEIVSLIRGEVGSQVILTFDLDQGVGQEQFTLKRAEFEIPSISSYRLPSNEQIGVIIIHRFSDRTAEEVDEAYKGLSDEGIQGLVLDLRGNSGGILEAAIDLSKYFLDNGLILSEIERDGEEREFSVNRPGDGSNIPLVVLVDGGSASASEILAAALQENERASLVGQRTYGKSSVQTVLTLSDGSSLHVTTARWFTPKMISIDGVGIEPDLAITPSDPNRDEILEAGVALLMDLIEGM
jgi:carboxyl-terminal processing protease